MISLTPEIWDKANSVVEATCIVPMAFSTAAKFRDKTHLGQSLFSNWYWGIYSWWCGLYFVGLGQFWSFAMFIPQALLNATNVYLYYQYKPQNKTKLGCRSPDYVLTNIESEIAEEPK